MAAQRYPFPHLEDRAEDRELLGGEGVPALYDRKGRGVRQRFLEAVTSESIVRNTENRPIYSVPFRRIFKDGIRNYRLEFVRLDLPGGKTGIVGGFRNADKEAYREQDCSWIRREF